MQDLYTKESYTAIDTRVKQRFLLLGIACGLLIGTAVFSALVKPPIEWLTMVSVLLAGCTAIFVIDLLCMPLVRYRRLIRGALTGRSHTKTMEFVRFEPDISVVEGVACRGEIFLGDPDKHGSREQLFYWDAQLPLPSLAEGQEYEVRYCGRNIIAI